MSIVKTHAMKFSKICSKNERKKKRSVPLLPDLCLWVHCGAEEIITDASWAGQFVQGRSAVLCHPDDCFCTVCS